MRKLWIKRTAQILGCVVFCCVFAWAQKGEDTVKESLTLADLGVTAEQKIQINVMWKLKRQKHIQAVEDLKTINRFVKDSLIGDDEIRETLEKFRTKRKEMQDQIDKAEKALTQTLSPRAQLHLTVLGILDNGLPRRTARTKEDKAVGQKNSDGSTPAERSLENKTR